MRICELACIPQLQALDLGNTKVTDAGLRHVASLKRLHSLNLWKTQVSAVGLKNLSNIKMLRYLNLESTQVTDPGLLDLACLEHLEELNVKNTPVTEAAVKTLEAATASLQDRPLNACFVHYEEIDCRGQNWADSTSSNFFQQMSRPGDQTHCIGIFRDLPHSFYRSGQQESSARISFSAVLPRGRCRSNLPDDPIDVPGNGLRHRPASRFWRRCNS